MTDQFVWSRRLNELGVSPPPIPRGELSAARLAEAIRGAASDETMRIRARALGTAITAEGGVAAAAEAFEHLVGRNGTATGAHRALPHAVSTT
jgi:UDP:flavonoid glycosyltransferase YjiC (YdhE family)